MSSSSSKMESNTVIRISTNTPTGNDGIITAPKSKPPRECGTCTKCCEGYLVSEIYGEKMFPGNPCRFMKPGAGCSIYESRPATCVQYKCLWLLIPDIPLWMKPENIKAIISLRQCAYSKEQFWSLSEAGGILRSDVLSWTIKHCLKHGINLQYQVEGGLSRIGTEAFQKALNKGIIIT